MPLAVGSIADGPLLGGHHEFRFVGTSRPLVQGTIGATVILAGLFGWASWSGRIRNFDATYAAVLLSSAGVAITFVVGRLWHSARKAALALGHIELSDEGVRWHRNGSVGFNTAWKDIERATIDTRNSTLVLFRKDATPILIGVLSQHGVPSGFVALERFGEIAELVGRRVPTSPHEGSTDSRAGRRTVLLGIGACGTAVALYAANVLVGSLLHWTRLLIPMPVFIGAVGLLALVAGARVRSGKGPLVSPLYRPGYRAVVVRFLVVASVANFVLLAVANTLAR